MKMRTLSSGHIVATGKNGTVQLFSKDGTRLVSMTGLQIMDLVQTCKEIDIKELAKFNQDNSTPDSEIAGSTVPTQDPAPQVKPTGKAKVS